MTQHIREAAGISSALPETYTVIIEIHPTGQPAVSLRVSMDQIRRADIMAPDYGVPPVRSLVQQLEHFVWNMPIPKTDTETEEG